MNKYTRRFFIKSVGVSAASLFVSSWTFLSCNPKKPEPFNFVQVCDPQLGFGGYEHDLATFRQAVKQINALRPAFVVICGDLVNKSDDKSFADFNEIKAGLTMPCHCAPGNHDVGNEPTVASLERYREVIGRDYYSFEHNGYTFVVVNTQLWKAPLAGESAEHDEWLKRELQLSSKEMQGTFIVGHYPLYLKEPDERDEYFNIPLDKRKELLTLFDGHGVAAMLGGHTHRTIINDYKGIQMVNAEATSKNFDDRPLGFRAWSVADQKPPKTFSRKL